MNTDEFKRIVALATVAHDAERQVHEAKKRAQEALDAYVAAATTAYASQAFEIAKKAYDDCANTSNFKDDFTNRLNNDFNTHFPQTHPVHHEHEEKYQPPYEQKFEPKSDPVKPFAPVANTENKDTRLSELFKKLDKG